MSLVARKLVFVLSDQAPHQQGCTKHKMGRGLKTLKKIYKGFYNILAVERLYYLCSENKGADQLRLYRKADLRLGFAYAKSRFSHDAAYIIKPVKC